MSANDNRRAGQRHAPSAPIELTPTPLLILNTAIAEYPPPPPNIRPGEIMKTAAGGCGTIGGQSGRSRHQPIEEPPSE